jgi:L-aminopeptidase/D-esterase-like protein
MYNSEFNIKDISIGHYTDEKNGTGSTVIIAKKGAVVGVSVRGSAPGTRETDLADPKNAVTHANAVLLTGGSAFGLDSSAGVMQYLEQRNMGFKTKEAYVPIVLGAVLYDLGYKSSKIRPDKESGYKACQDAKEKNFLQGSIGAGTGATCGKIFGSKKAVKSGLGVAAVKLGGGIYVAAVFAANPLGDIYDFKKNELIAGIESPTTSKIFIEGLAGFLTPNKGENTTIGTIITNAKLTKAEANKLADIAHDGIAMAVRPCHTMFDGDTVFALSTDKFKCNINRVLVAATEVAAMAIANSVYSLEESKKV